MTREQWEQQQEGRIELCQGNIDYITNQIKEAEELIDNLYNSLHSFEREFQRLIERTYESDLFDNQADNWRGSE